MTLLTRNREPDREPRWLLARFAVFTALAIVIAAVAIVSFVHTSAQRRAENLVSFHTQFVADSVLSYHLSRADFKGPVSEARRVELDRIMEEDVLVEGALKAKLYNLDGVVVYSTDSTEIGLEGDVEEIKEIALSGSHREMSTLGAEGGQGGDIKVIESYVPFRLEGPSPVGVFELYQDYAPVKNDALQVVVPVAVALALALLALYLALFPLLRQVTNVLKHRAARLEAQAGELRETLAKREQAEEALRQAQKMDAVGRLAGGMAHDFNNLLLVIRGYTSLMTADLDEDDPRRQDLGEIEAAVDKAAALTGQLLTFSRRRTTEMTALDLGKVIRDSHGMLARLLGEDVELSYDVPDSPSVVRSDLGQLGQLLMNLAVNARDAMPEGGRLHVAVRHEDKPAGCERCRLEPGEYVVLSVTDTGCGMDEETRSKIFEPFYTTKEVGKGTGLGLSIVYGVVQQAGGAIDVESVPGRGTTFTIFLPKSEEEAVEGKKATDDASKGPAVETILLAEDEEAVRRLLGGALKKQGYTVLEAEDGREALKRAAEHDGTIDLLLTDVVMPRMGGPELAKRLTDFRPETRVLYMSGYVDRQFAAFGGQTEGVEESGIFLQKPFELPTLLDKVRLVLEDAVDTTAS